LPEAYREIYDRHYESNRKGQTKVSFLAMQMEKWLHKKVPEMMRGLGKGVKSFKEGMNEPLEGKTEEAKDETAEPKPEDGAGQ